MGALSQYFWPLDLMSGDVIIIICSQPQQFLRLAAAMRLRQKSLESVHLLTQPKGFQFHARA